MKMAQHDLGIRSGLECGMHVEHMHANGIGKIVGHDIDLIVGEGILLETKGSATPVVVVIAFPSGTHRLDGDDGGEGSLAVGIVIGVVGSLGDTGGDADASASSSVEVGQSHAEGEYVPRTYSLQ